jgi:hypothetical protein
MNKRIISELMPEPMLCVTAKKASGKYCSVSTVRAATLETYSAD